MGFVACVSLALKPKRCNKKVSIAANQHLGFNVIACDVCLEPRIRAQLVSNRLEAYINLKSVNALIARVSPAHHQNGNSVGLSI